MQYYSISPDLYCYPQIKGFGDTIRIADPRHLFHFLSAYQGVRFTKEPPKWGPHLDYLVLNPRLRKKGPSDILSEYIGISNGFIISGKFKNILNDFNLSSHVYYDCKVCVGDMCWNYYYLFFYGHLGDKIDFNKSVLLLTNHIGNIIYEKKIFQDFESYKKYVIEKRSNHGFRFEKIVFKSNLKTMDMLYINLCGSTEPLVSSKLRDRLLIENVNNLEFRDKGVDFITYS